MKAKIRSIADINTDNERIILDIIGDTDIGEYVIFDTTYHSSTNQVSNKMKHSFWFPDQKVKIGDVVVLYTKSGKQSSTKNANGAISYFFFWGLNSKIWNNLGDCAILLHVDEWTFFRTTEK